MTRHNEIGRMGGQVALPRRALVALAGALVVMTSGCNLLDVSNTNSVSESALDNPAAAGPIVRGRPTGRAASRHRGHVGRAGGGPPLARYQRRAAG